MAVSYTRSFQHQDWVDNVNRVQAAGQDGFNVRFHGLEAEFDRLSQVIDEIDNALSTVLSSGGGQITGSLYVAGDLGVGTSTPQAKVDVVGGDLRWGNASRLQVDQGGSIELGGDGATPGTGTPYIDFHFNGLTQDFNTRIINDADGRLSLKANEVDVAAPLKINTRLEIRDAAGGTDSDILWLERVQRAANQNDLRVIIGDDQAGDDRFIVGPVPWQDGQFRGVFAVLNSGNCMWANQSLLSPDQGGSIELGGNGGVPGTGTPYIDFHFNGLTQDFNTRIINDADGQLRIEGNVNISGNLGTNGQSHVPRTPGWGGGVHTWDLEAEGSIWSPNKNFLIDHPLDPERRFLVHGCLEGPESGVFYRGQARLAGGRATVELPHYFEALTRAEERTVMLTPLCSDGSPVSALAASSVEEGAFHVRATDDANAEQEFYWQVMAVRADVEPLEVEIDKRRPEELAATASLDA